MQRDTLFTLLAQRLGGRDDLIPRMETEAILLQEIKLEHNQWLPWFLETEMAYTTTAVGEYRLALPTDFLQEVEEQAVWRDDDGVLVPLRKMDFDDMIQVYSGTGAPVAYALGARYFYLAYTPDAEYTIKMRYYSKDDLLTSNIENRWLRYAADLYIAELGAVLAEKHMQHFELAQTFRADAAAAWQRLYAQHVARSEVNVERVMEG